jgi:glycosyltransferase involved in cell wall biosynthesis
MVVTTTTGPPGWGGSEKYWYDAVLGGAAPPGWHVEVVMERRESTERRAAALRSAGVGVVWNNDSVRVSDTARLIAAGRRRFGSHPPDPEQQWWSEVITASQPDLLWLNLPTAMRICTRSSRLPAVVAAAAGIPYWIVVQHAFENGFPPDDEKAEVMREDFLAARRVIFIAENNRRSIERAIATRLPNACMSANAVTDDFLAAGAAVYARRPPRDTGPMTFLTLGRADPHWKGQHLVFEALSREAWRQRDWRLILAGGGNGSDTVARLIHYYGLDEGRVELIEFHDDVLPLIERADVAVMPSLSEGTPFAAVEAMAAGRPVIATPVGGFPELAREGETGWLAESTEAAHVADALERAVGMRSSWEEMGQRAATHVREHHRASTVAAELASWLTQDVAQEAVT